MENLDNMNLIGRRLPAGDYDIEVVAVEDGDRAHPVRVTITGRKFDDRVVTIDRGTLEEVARELDTIVDRIHADEMNSRRQHLGSGTVRVGGEDGVEFPVRGLTITSKDLGGAARDYERLQRGRRSRGIDGDALDRIAEVYKAAKAEGRPVQGAVAEAMSVTKSRAAHLIKMARDSGRIEPVQKGGSDAEGR